MSAKKVLVVEDEPSISQLAAEVLTDEGFEVDVAVNGKVAQEMIRNMVKEKPYELCLLDMKMPEMNGMELYEWMKVESPQLASGVIFTTGSVMQVEIMDFIEQSGQPYLPKPFTPTELRNIVINIQSKAE
jgi:DNA-binding response OmpR family regulator